jgi:hypothetical protein
MEVWNSFLRFCSSDYSIDYWSDMAILHATELANDLSPADWNYLRGFWMTLEPTVQARIAEVTSGITNWTDDIGELLVAMLSSASTEVLEATVDSLNSIAQVSSERLRGTAISQAFRRVTPRDRIMEKVIESLNKHLTIDS